MAGVVGVSYRLRDLSLTLGHVTPLDQSEFISRNSPNHTTDANPCDSL